MKLDNVRWSNIRPLGGWEIIEKRRWFYSFQAQVDHRPPSGRPYFGDNIRSENAPLQSHVVVRELMRRKR